MATVTVCSEFGAQENKFSHCFHCFPIYLPWRDGIRCHDLSFSDVEFSASSFTLLFHFHQQSLNSSLLSAIRVVSSAYLRLLIFLLAILIPAWASSRLAFRMMYSAYIQPQCTYFPILNQSVVPCPVLTVASWSTHRFLRRQIRWSGIPNFLKNFPQFVVIHTVLSYTNNLFYLHLGDGFTGYAYVKNYEITQCKIYTMAQMVTNQPTMWGTWVQPLDWEYPLEKGMATHWKLHYFS